MDSPKGWERLSLSQVLLGLGRAHQLLPNPLWGRGGAGPDCQSQGGSARLRWQRPQCRAASRACQHLPHLLHRCLQSYAHLGLTCDKCTTSPVLFIDLSRKSLQGHAGRGPSPHLRASLLQASKSGNSFFPGKTTFFFAKHILNKQHVNSNSCFRLHKRLIVSSRACPRRAVGRAGRGHSPPPRECPGGRPRNTAPAPSVSLTLRTDRQTDLGI